MKNFDDLVAKVDSLKPDVAKHEAGNASAGTRLRVGMMDVIKLSKAVRQDVADARAQA